MGQTAPDECWGTEEPHKEEPLAAAVAHNAESQVRTHMVLSRRQKALQYPNANAVHPGNLGEEEEVPMPFHSGEEYDRECERCRKAFGMRRRPRRSSLCSCTSLA